MKRLTARNENGEAYYKRCYESPCDGTGEACDDCNFIDIKVCEALAAYEDNGITPEQMREISRLYQVRCEELNKVNAELAELKEQLPPCKLGDTVYAFEMGKPIELEIIKISMFRIEGKAIINVECQNSGCFRNFVCEEFGKTVFLTKEEAEQALAKMKGV